MEKEARTKGRGKVCSFSGLYLLDSRRNSTEAPLKRKEEKLQSDSGGGGSGTANKKKREIG